MREDQKLQRLVTVLGEWYPQGSILCFVERQETADMLVKQLRESGLESVKSIHGGKSQEERDTTLLDFRQKKLKMLVATSVAARGLDVKLLRLVINYHAPNHYEDYVHRVGRTGRAGNKGTSITFLTYDDENLAPDLVNALDYVKHEVPGMMCMMYVS